MTNFLTSQGASAEELDQIKHGILQLAGMRPLRIWPAPTHRSQQIRTGHYWHWQCRICNHATKDLIPSLPAAYDEAVYHLGGHGEEENDDG